MSKYRRNTNNTSRGLIWGISAAGVAFVIVKVLHVIHGVQNLNELEKNEQVQDQSGIMVRVRDSVTGKIDTVLLSDYLEKRRQDSILRSADTRISR